MQRFILPVSKFGPALWLEHNLAAIIAQDDRDNLTDRVAEMVL